MSELVFLKFERGAGPYRGGEIAGFTPAEAQPYLAMKAAREVPRPDPTTAAATPAPAPLVVVRFLQSHPPYLEGELAGFGAERALQLVAAGIAAKHGDVRPEARPEPKSTPRTGVAPVELGLVQLKFVKAAQGYRKGDVAGFPPEEAERLLEAGVAVEPGSKAAGAKPAGGGDPDASKVDPNAEVLGLDDRDPDWREKQEKRKAAEQPPADKMIRGDKRKKK